MTAITYRLTGRLGNQLHLWACARTVSIRYDLGFLYRPFTEALDPLPTPDYPMVARSGSLAWKRLTGRARRLPGHEWDESGNESGLLKAEYLPHDGLVILDWSGVFRRVDEFRAQLVDELLGGYEKPQVDPAHVAVHFRQDDAAYPQPFDYYLRALRDLGVSDGDVVSLYSDGPRETWAEQITAQTGAHVVLPSGSAMGDLLEMSAHRRLVLSQSWFSYYAAFLSEATEVLAPAEFCYYPWWRSP